ncbi:hypothetical protein OS493_027894 [Desmophyllum pertusum]|uniref:Uncharacterized protein n=1 Tax=Desmophyllum pertusum TaxID=174260 RepID=A0A9X0CJ53_9CNID|nr:hypothetical protein OS493_027894 [Desmophyllum pertusum]
MVTSVYQTSPSNQFGHPVSTAMHSARPQFLIQSPSNHWQQAERMSYQHSPPITADNRRSSFTSNQFRARSSSLVPMFHPDQFKRRPTEPARLSYSRGLRRYQPY